MDSDQTLGNPPVEDEPSIDFSIEELVAMVEILELRGLPGLGADPLDFPTDELRDAVLASARRSLVARRFVVPNDDGGFEIARPVAHLVSRAARSGIQIRAIFESDAAVETRCFAAEPDLAMEHSVVLGAVQRLTPFRTEQLLARVLEFCEIEARPESDAAPFTVGERELTVCAEMLAGGDHDAAVSALTGGSVPEPQATTFVNALERRVSSASVTVLHQPKPGEIHGGELTWIDCSDRGIWLTPMLDRGGDTGETHDIETASVTIEPTSAKWIAEELLSYLPGE